jgi:hypothetical protein
MNSKRMESPERIQGGAKLTAKTIWKTCQPWKRNSTKIYKAWRNQIEAMEMKSSLSK